MKSKPVTVMLDIPVLKKLRLIQALKINKTQKSVSFSRVLNDVLRKIL